jgi:CO/xanthine dehydrogenase Mo-binding subunit
MSESVFPESATPEVTPIAVQHLDQKPSGGGEEMMGPAAAAIANAYSRRREFGCPNTR